MKKNIVMISLLISGLSCGDPSNGDSGLDAAVDHAFSFAEAQSRRTIQTLGESDLFPRSTEADGSWGGTSKEGWTSGFFPGSLWYLYEETHDPFFKEAARRWTEGLREIQHFKGSHDVGFIVFNSFGNGNRIEPSEDYKAVILQTANALMTRYNPVVGCTKSWDWSDRWHFPVIVDNMMNLELLFWAAENGGSPEMRDAAISHATKTMENHVRPDGSTYHVLDYDTTTGEVVARETHQGYANESAWARGQAWAIYGFTMTYRYTRDERFLKTAERVADFYIGHLPDDGIPYWDFNAPGIPNEPKDASAAAVAASALFELCTFDVGMEKREEYREVAEHILASLCSDAYLAEGTPAASVLVHSTGNKPATSEIDVGIIYADYYFIEAMKRYRSPEAR